MVSDKPTRREMSHLIAMCDGKRHCFFDHELAKRLREAGWIWKNGSDWMITEEGRSTVARGVVTNAE
jgi:hypothetical protein